MTEQARTDQQSQPHHRTPWTEVALAGVLTDQTRNLSEQQKLQFMDQLAQRLSALQESEGYDRFTLPRVTMKRGYQEVARLQGHTKGVLSVHALPGEMLLSGSDDNTVRVWRQSLDGRWRSDVVKEHQSSVIAVQGCRDGLIISGSEDGVFKTSVSGTEGKWTSSRLTGSPVSCLHALPCGGIARGGPNGDIQFDTAAIVTSSAVCSIQALADGEFATAHQDGRVRLWKRGASEFSWKEVTIKISEFGLNAVHVTPDGRIVVGGDDGMVREFTPQADGGYLISEVGRMGGIVWYHQALPDGRIVTGGDDATIRIWQRDPSGVWHQEVLRGHSGCANSLQILPDGRIISAGSDTTIRIWDGGPVENGGAS